MLSKLNKQKLEDVVHKIYLQLIKHMDIEIGQFINQSNIVLSNKENWLSFNNYIAKRIIERLNYKPSYFTRLFNKFIFWLKNWLKEILICKKKKSSKT